MQESTITQKGQTTVPQSVRDALRVQPGARLCWHPMPDGSVIVRVKSRSVLDLAGMLEAPVGRPVKLADMSAWSRRGR